MKKILVPTDFSEQANYAFDLACQIAEKNQAEIIALHVLDYTGLYDFTAGSGTYPILGSPAGIEYDEKFLDTLYTSAQEKLQGFLDNYKDKNISITKKVKAAKAKRQVRKKLKSVKSNCISIYFSNKYTSLYQINTK